ncbi:MAG: UTP--glucose-1-phosphate uridylyltransferase [Leptospiraceae bacterium]|nr:UTP--glucose-1-phosphate uridylyltransferase [Leptospiraceae bacterium]
MARPSWEEIKSGIEQRMQWASVHEICIQDFLDKTRKVYDGATGLVDWSSIGDLHSDDIVEMESLEVPEGNAAISRFAIIKLNGGLGTSMGLSKAKSLIHVRRDATFFDIILKQIHHLREKTGLQIPLLFMNSFNTREDTLGYPGIADINSSLGLPADFLQNQVPRLDKETLLPVGDGQDAGHWCPPGHGDIYNSLWISGILDSLLEKGYSHAFISNGDNLGAVMHSGIAEHVIEAGLDFAMEVTPKSRADIKGGVLYRSLTGQQRIELLETAQVPPEHKDDFEDINRFQDFSINNLWVNLDSLRHRLKQGPLSLSLIVNQKSYNDIPVLQLESAMGAAVGQFDRTRMIRVPRKRFAPVKNCADLLVRRSDACQLDDNQALVLKSKVEPVVQLDDNYKVVQDFESRIQVPPSLQEAYSLTVEGPWLFDIPVKIHGDVRLINRSGAQKAISGLKRSTFKNESVKQ